MDYKISLLVLAKKKTTQKRYILLFGDVLRTSGAFNKVKSSVMPTEHLAFPVSPHPFTLASKPQTTTTWAAVTQGFPRIGFPLTTTRRPIFPHLASGIERERMRDRQQTAGMRFQITWFYLTKERAKRRGRDGGSWELQVRPRGWLRGNRPTVHQATNLSSYVMSQVQYSPGRLFKERPSRVADKKVIYLVATALHESLCSGYFGRRQTPGCRFWWCCGYF